MRIARDNRLGKLNIANTDLGRPFDLVIFAVLQRIGGFNPQAQLDGSDRRRFINVELRCRLAENDRYVVGSPDKAELQRFQMFGNHAVDVAAAFNAENAAY